MRTCPAHALLLSLFITACTQVPPASTPKTPPLPGATPKRLTGPGPLVGSSARPGLVANSMVTGRGAAGIANKPDSGALFEYDHQSGRGALSRGAYTWHPVSFSEAHALRALYGGQLVVRAPDGRLISLVYQRHVEHQDGNWTWIGREPGSGPGREAIITFGDQAVFGTIPNGDRPDFRVMMAAGRSWLVETDPEVLRREHPNALMPREPDYRVPPTSIAEDAPVQVAGVQAASRASVAAATTVDLVMGYTSGFAQRLGGVSGVMTRLTYLVDVANQAYLNSQVDAQIRLVRAVEVAYTDASANQQALYDLTGVSCTGESGSLNCEFVGVPATLQPLHDARAATGADLVSLVRNFNDPEHQGCGIAWLNGGGRQVITTADEVTGMSVVSDSGGNVYPDNGFVCRDETLVHEIGHNMGSAHDRATADGDDNVLQDNEYGAFIYSFGYKTSVSGNFFTIMAYGDSGQPSVRVFSNPDLTVCANQPCGVANQADNARSLRQTIPTIAAFGTVPPLPADGAPFDVNSDGRSDIFFNGGSAMAYWAMNGVTRIGDAYLGDAGAPFKLIDFGNFDGTGGEDVLWSNGTEVRIWFNDGRARYVVYQMGTYGGGWEPFAAADVNGDGRSDILFRGGTALAYWLIDGAAVLDSRYAGDGGTGYRVVVTGEFTGDRAHELVWANGAQLKMWLNGGAGEFTASVIGNYGGGWQPFAAGDVDGDGKNDLLFLGGTAIAYWRMDGAHVMTSTYAGNAGPGYVPFAVADYNADGTADLGWHNGQNILLWMNSGAGRYDAFTAGSFVCCWRPVGGL